MGSKTLYVTNMETRKVPHRKDSSSVEDLILALSDKRVSDIIAGIFEQKLNPILQSLSEVLEKNKTLEKDVSKLQGELAEQTQKLTTWRTLRVWII